MELSCPLTPERSVYTNKIVDSELYSIQHEEGVQLSRYSYSTNESE